MTGIKLLDRLKKRAVMANLQELRDFVEEQGRVAGVSGEDEHDLHVALDELLTNVIKYAYPADDPGEVTVSCAVRGNEFHVRIRDCGIPFNPLTEAPVPDVNASIDDRAIGGLGIYMLIRMLPGLYYKHENGCNIVEFYVGAGKS